MMYRYNKKLFSVCSHTCFTTRHRFYHSTSTITDIINNFLSIRYPKITLQSLTKYHAYIITTGHHSTNIFISSKLISLYACHRQPLLSKHVFDSFHGYKDVFLWNSMIKAFFSNGMYLYCLDLYDCMRGLGKLLPNQFTVPMVVSACAEVSDLGCGMNVHGLGVKVGVFEESSAVGSSFIYMYMKCGYVESARQVFDEMPLRDVVAWTALVIGYVQNRESEKGFRCVCEMFRTCEEVERPNFRTLEGGFQACADLEQVDAGRCLHGMAIKSGLEQSFSVQSSILSMYSKCGTVDEAYMSFCEVSVKDIKLWTAIISLYGKFGCITQCISKFMEMIISGINPDPIVISCVIFGLANSTSIYTGKTFHGFMIRRNYDRDQMVDNALVSMYCKFGLIHFAENVFDSVCILDKEVCNSMLQGYSKIGCPLKCIELFTEMIKLGTIPDSNSLVSVISSCSQTGRLHLGGSLHCYAVKTLMIKHVSVSNSLVDMYASNGDLITARRLFCRVINKDIISWNTVISAYMHCGNYSEAFYLFDKMVLEGIKPNVATLTIMLSVCAHMASFEKGDQIHKYIDDEMLLSNVNLATALIDMYAKCGKLKKSEEIFKNMRKRDVISWNVMISGYGMHGDATSAIETFKQMELSNVKPNELTFLAVLSACNHAGLVNEGKYLFEKMGDYCLMPTLKHYTCMVDILGRSGFLVEAENLVDSMPMVPDGGLWGALLSACKTHNDPEMGIRIAKRAIEYDPENDGYYVIISNLYDSIGMWEEAEKMRNLMKEREVKKAVGWSAV
ncbi:pentatricopeptide repeat-containing protein At4g39952, mitochondrial [Rutidosis leptorrhynchoides]|uniref:pentatricopeptide repeat-containing protein At4g39952, mitochondrial n=1 Tax=Rutidosis leptorrhynchoides TaxID=125765 RepID=UPI003A9A3565